MWSMGADDWIKYGWDSGKWVPGAQLTIDLRSKEIAGNLDIHHVAVSAVHKIVDTYPAPFTLMCSGGIDSQTMIWCWSLAKVPFNIMSTRYKSNGVFFNEYDLVSLRDFCNTNSFTITYQDFDLINFLEFGLPDIARDNDCDSPQICTHIKMTESITSGTVCFSGNCLMPRAHLNYTLLGMHRYALRSSTQSRQIIPFFLLHDPVLAKSFVKTSASFKSLDDIYRLAGVPIVSPPSKYNGFENIKEFYDKYYDRVTTVDRLQYAAKPSKRVFDLLFRHPYEGAGNQYKDSVQVNQIL